MSDRNSTPQDARPDGLASLLGIAVEPPEALSATTEQRTAERLMTWLSGPLSAGGGQAPRVFALGSMSVSLPDGADGGLGDLLRYIDEPLADTLLGGRADLECLRAIKERSKRVSLSAESDREHRHVATAVYYAAIASALLQHGQRISRYTYRKLAEAFGKLAAEPWMAPELAGHFCRAEAAARSLADKEP